MPLATRRNASRFAALLESPARARLDHNRPLLERPNWIVAPTLGAIVPNWLIVVPRQAALNLRSWKKQLGKSPQEILIDLSEHLGISISDLVWFEHGPSELQSAVGCGADYAHLHVILTPTFTFEVFSECTILQSNVTWKTSTFDFAYDALPNSGSYLIAGSAETAIFATHVEETGSQFFRRMVALISDQADLWDYTQFPHTNNIYQTIVNFRDLEGRSRRDRGE